MSLDFYARVLLFVGIEQRVERGRFTTGCPPGKNFEFPFAGSSRERRRLHYAEQRSERDQ